MIIGFSHFIENTLYPEETIKRLLSKGYSSDFSDVGVLNHPVKKVLLKEYNDHHDLHMLRHTDCYDIEVIDHYSSENKIQDRIVLHENNIVEITVPEGTLNLEYQFWQDLGLSKNGNSFSLKRPVPAWQVILDFKEGSEPLAEQMLDLNGITSIAFITKSIDSCMRRINESLSWKSEIFKLEVNGKKLSIILVKSPTGLIIELIEV